MTERSELGSLGENEAKRWSDIGASSEGRHGQGGRVQGGLRRPGGGRDTQVGGRPLDLLLHTNNSLSVNVNVTYKQSLDSLDSLISNMQTMWLIIFQG